MFDVGAFQSALRNLTGALALSVSLAPAFAQEPTIVDRTCIWVLGDSLASALAPHLAALMPQRRILNDGFGGQSPTAIAGRAGAIAVNVVVQDERLPVSGPAQLLSVVPEILTTASSSRPRATLAGRLQGVAGTLLWQRNVGYRFVANAPGQEVRTARTAPFVPDLGDREACLLVLWAGRNGVTTDRTKTLAGLIKITEARRLREAPFLILTVPNMPVEGRSTPAYENISGVNDDLVRRYPQNTLDIRRWLIQNGLADAGIVPNVRSRAEMAEDAVPAQLLADGLHPLPDVMKAIARYVVGEIARRQL